MGKRPPPKKIYLSKGFFGWRAPPGTRGSQRKVVWPPNCWNRQAFSVQEANGIGNVGLEEMVVFMRPGRIAGGDQEERGCVMCRREHDAQLRIRLPPHRRLCSQLLTAIPSVALLLPGVAMSLHPRTSSLMTWTSKSLEEPSWSPGGTAASEKQLPSRSPGEVSSLLTRARTGPRGQPVAAPRRGERPVSQEVRKATASTAGSPEQ